MSKLSYRVGFGGRGGAGGCMWVLLLGMCDCFCTRKLAYKMGDWKLGERAGRGGGVACSTSCCECGLFCCCMTFRVNAYSFYLLVLYMHAFIECTNFKTV